MIDHDEWRDGRKGSVPFSSCVPKPRRRGALEEAARPAAEYGGVFGLNGLPNIGEPGPSSAGCEEGRERAAGPVRRPEAMLLTAIVSMLGRPARRETASPADIVKKLFASKTEPKRLQI